MASFLASFHQTQLELAVARGLVAELREREKRLVEALARLEEDTRLLRQLLGEEKQEKKDLLARATRYEAMYEALREARDHAAIGTVATGRMAALEDRARLNARHLVE
jgi:hypothetical protein